MDTSVDINWNELLPIIQEKLGPVDYEMIRVVIPKDSVVFVKKSENFKLAETVVADILADFVINADGIVWTAIKYKTSSRNYCYQPLIYLPIGTRMIRCADDTEMKVTTDNEYWCVPQSFYFLVDIEATHDITTTIFPKHTLINGWVDGHLPSSIGAKRI